MEFVGDPLRLARALEDLSEQFARALPGRLAEIQDEFAALLRSPQDREGLERMRARVHKLAGSGTTFGFAALSQEALDLEDHLKRLGSREEPLTRADVEALRSRLSLVRGAALGPLSAETDPGDGSGTRRAG
jgi:chemotaxis protein histidine kinase CheA